MAVAIISIAQQASPKATGQREERRAQFTMPSAVESMMFCLRDSSMDSAAVSVTLMRLSDILGGSRLWIVSQATEDQGARSQIAKRLLPARPEALGGTSGATTSQLV